MAKKAAKPKTKTKPNERERVQSQNVPASRCMKCGSTERDPYNSTRYVNHGGIENGVEYNRVAFRYTKCKECGQRRCDRTQEMA